MVWVRGAFVIFGNFYLIFYRFSGKWLNKVEVDKIYLEKFRILVLNIKNSRK